LYRGGAQSGRKAKVSGPYSAWPAAPLPALAGTACPRCRAAAGMAGCGRRRVWAALWARVCVHQLCTSGLPGTAAHLNVRVTARHRHHRIPRRKPRRVHTWHVSIDRRTGPPRGPRPVFKVLSAISPPETQLAPPVTAFERTIHGSARIPSDSA
jgi:hypothetical protein